jgi:hypothetical protein
MAKAGYCSGCGQNVWLYENGTCPAGHGAESISNIYDADPEAVVAEPEPVVAEPVVPEPEPVIPEPMPLSAMPAPAPETRIPSAAQVSQPTPAAVAVAQDSAAKPKRSKKGLFITLGIVLGLVIIAGVVVGAIMLLGDEGGDPAIEAAADYQSAVYEGRWDDAMDMASESEARDMQRFLDGQDEDNPLVYAKVVGRRWADGQLVLETERDKPNSDETVSFRYYFMREDADSNIVTVLWEIEEVGKDPRSIAGFYLEMFKEGGDWKVLSARMMQPNEMEEYDFFD